MTSSLVGSEMCIRDRRRREQPATVPMLLALQTMQTMLMFLHCHRRPPVSYTHLTLPTICSV
eukprot:11928361-Prorocentrum_lima.AAC.1